VTFSLDSNTPIPADALTATIALLYYSNPADKKEA